MLPSLELLTDSSDHSLERLWIISIDRDCYYSFTCTYRYCTSDKTLSCEAYYDNMKGIGARIC